MQAINALIQKIDQKTIFPSCVCFGNAGGSGFTIDEKNLNSNSSLVKGIINKKLTIIFIKVKNSFHCQI